MVGFEPIIRHENFTFQQYACTLISWKYFFCFLVENILLWIVMHYWTNFKYFLWKIWSIDIQQFFNTTKKEKKLTKFLVCSLMLLHNYQTNPFYGNFLHAVRKLLWHNEQDLYLLLRLGVINYGIIIINSSFWKRYESWIPLAEE